MHITAAQQNEIEADFGRTCEECAECGPVIFDPASDCYLQCDTTCAPTYWNTCEHID